MPCGLRTADVFPVVASLPPRSDDRKYVCGSQARYPGGQRLFMRCLNSGFGQVFMVNRAARDFCLQPTLKHPTAREKKPLVARLGSKFPLAFKTFMHIS